MGPRANIDTKRKVIPLLRIKSLLSNLHTCTLCTQLPKLIPYNNNTTNYDDRKDNNNKNKKEIIMITTIKVMTEIKMINVIRNFLAAEHWRPVWPSEHYFQFSECYL